MGSDVIPSPLEEDWNGTWVLTGGRGRGQGRARAGAEGVGTDLSLPALVCDFFLQCVFMTYTRN